jgi:hypothetical protein
VKDLETLLSSDATEFERQLLGAAAAERPSPELQLRMQQALGLAPMAPQGPDASLGGPEASGVEAAGSKWTASSWLKVLLGVGAGAALVAGGLALRSSEPALPTPTSTPVPEQPAPAAPVAAPTRGESSAAMSRELREEIELLDRVRTALGQRDVREASALLDHYATRFPAGALAREASVLRARTAQVAPAAR